MKKGIVSNTVFAAILAAFLVIGGPAVAAGADITGHWWGSNGVEYDITQVGTTFSWKVPATGEIGVGTINGKDCSAGWPFGFATGMIVTNPSGAAIEISWSNSVVFRRPAPGGGSGPGPGPGPSPTPGGGGGGSSNDLEFTFGPNPAWARGEVWLNFNKPVAHDVKIYFNGKDLTGNIVKYTSNYNVVVRLILNVKPGPVLVEYKGKRFEANQPKKNLELKPLDVSGQWNWPEEAAEFSIKQNGSMFVMTLNTAGSPTVTYDGEVLSEQYNVRYYTNKAKTGSRTFTVSAVDPHGRVTEMEYWLPAGFVKITRK
jgi:hypothetical protein